MRRRNAWHRLEVDLLISEQSRAARLGAVEQFPHDQREAKRLSRRHGRHGVGELPWALAQLRSQLVVAFLENDADETIRIAGYVAHFAADAVDPFRCSVNADGHKTGNLRLRNGVNARVLGRSVRERFGEALILRHAMAYEAAIKVDRSDFEPTRDVVAAVFEAIQEGLSLHDRIAHIDRALTDELSIKTAKDLEDRQAEYFSRMHEQCEAMAIDRLQAGAILAANLIGGAWVEAGGSPAQGASVDRSPRRDIETISTTTLLGSSNSDVFHHHNCPFVKRINEKNLVQFRSLRDATQAGRRACKRCQPK